MLLLVYIREDASTVRQPVYGLLFANLLMVGLVWLMRFHIVASVMAGGAPPDFRFMDEMGGLMLWGTTLLFVDAILIVLLYEALGRWLSGSQTLRIVASAAAILTLDQVGFYLALHVLGGAPLSVFWSGWLAKMAAAAFYGVLTGLYLRLFEGRQVRGARVRLVDVFDVLTYRERYEALLRDSGHDAVTGLLDRGRFDRDGETAMKRAAERHRPVSLLIVDIDHFKRINDRYGHAAGDEALRRIAQELGDAVREGDRVYRYGGEEFIVICEGLPHKAALLAGERLRLGVSSMVIGGIDMHITASVGVATGPEDGADLRSLFAIADARLYEAKFAGRDRVIGWRAPPPSESVLSFR
jgi:diguanylate cyclase (GGDEF)-like protein